VQRWLVILSLAVLVRLRLGTNGRTRHDSQYRASIAWCR